MLLRKPVHPGEILKEDFLTELDIGIGDLAKAVGVPPPQIEGVLNKQQPINPDLARRLADFFSTSPKFWMNLQNQYDAATHSFD